MMKELILGIAIAWLFGKIIKAIIDWTRDKKVSLKVLFHDGGMPSTHTVAVVSLATALFLEQGLSALFVLSAVLALIVINDALKVRWIVGEQSKTLNQLMKDSKDYKKLNERVGHKPAEVIVGLIIGIIVPVIVYAVF